MSNPDPRYRNVLPYFVASALVVISACNIAAHGAIDSKMLGERREYLVYTPP